LFSPVFWDCACLQHVQEQKEETGEDYFLADGACVVAYRFSLIAANISTEQFVGMNGGAAGNVGFAIASYDWMAAITLVFVAWFFLPRFLQSGIYTIPEFLEYRYSPVARSIMAFLHHDRLHCRNNLPPCCTPVR